MGRTIKGFNTGKNGQIIIRPTYLSTKSYIKVPLPCNDLSSDELKKIPAIKKDEWILGQIVDKGCERLYDIYNGWTDCKPRNDNFYKRNRYNLFDVCKKTCKKCDIGRLPKATTSTTTPKATTSTTTPKATTSTTTPKATTSTTISNAIGNDWVNW